MKRNIVGIIGMILAIVVVAVIFIAKKTKTKKNSW